MACCTDMPLPHRTALLVMALLLSGCLAMQGSKRAPSGPSSTTAPGFASAKTTSSTSPPPGGAATSGDVRLPAKRACEPPTTTVGPFCLLRRDDESEAVLAGMPAVVTGCCGYKLTLSRPEGGGIWSGVGSGIAEATEDHFDVLVDYRGNMGGAWTSTRWVRKGDAFTAGPMRDLTAEEEARDAKNEAQKVDSAWAVVERVGDDLATKKFLHGFAVQHTTGARNARAVQRMVEHMKAITQDDFCPAVKTFISKSSKTEFAKRAKKHCDESPPTAGGLNGEQVECRGECRAVFATPCP